MFTAMICLSLLLALGGPVIAMNTSYGMKKFDLKQRTLSSYWDNRNAKELSKKQFRRFLNLLFTDFRSYSTVRVHKSLFNTFDTNGDGVISVPEFEKMWKEWVQVILSPKFAILIVDVQNDFIDGTLSVRNISDNRNPECIVPVINDIAKSLPWNMVVYTQDWHPKNHISFFENIHLRKLYCRNNFSAPDIKVFDTVRFADNTTYLQFKEQTLWPQHCVQNTWGAELHKDLVLIKGSLLIRKGMDPDVDSYSAFWDNDGGRQTKLHTELLARGITDVVICGIAYDICVKSTALHAMKLGYRTTIVDDASCGTSSANTKAAKKLLLNKYGKFLQSSQLKKLFSGEDRPIYLGIQHAQAIAKKMQKQKLRR